MAFTFDDISIQHQLWIGAGAMPALGLGPSKVRGAALIEGPQIVGLPHPYITATLMVGPLVNPDSPAPIIPGSLCYGSNTPYSLAVVGPAAVLGPIDAAESITSGVNIQAQGEVLSNCGAHRLSKKKNFDIPHPSKEGWRLRHTCPEGPSNDVYIRGRIRNQKEIQLPSYWKDFVDVRSITVNLTPVGSHQHVIVKRIDESKVYLQSNGGLPIDCFYHIFAERKDGDKLIPEYPGKTPEDYPGDNSGYSIVGYNYDVR